MICTGYDGGNLIIEPGTGDIEPLDYYDYTEIPFGKYVVKIKLSKDGKFLEIVEIRVRQDFLSFQQKMINYGSHNVDEYYQE